MKGLEDNKVFVVDDNEMQLMMMDYVLSKEKSFKVTGYKSGEECIANLDKKPDAIVLDYKLPGLDGMQTFRAIKQRDPDIPVFVITATDDPSLEAEFLKAGVFSYIVKQSDAFHKLGSTIESLLGNSVSILEHKQHQRKLRILLSTGLILLAAAAFVVLFTAKLHGHFL